jgi:hypothetical protein
MLYVIIQMKLFMNKMCLITSVLVDFARIIVSIKSVPVTNDKMAKISVISFRARIEIAQ